MDGNGRWATGRGLPVAAGHREGTRALRRTVEAAIDLGVTTLVVYAFSTENWSRPPDEVTALMEILGETIDRELPDLAHAGRPHPLPRPARPGPAGSAASGWESWSARPRSSTRSSLWIAFDYGGRAELVEAARRCVEDGLTADEIDEAGARGAPLCAGAARDRPPDPHLGRVPDLELHALGDGLRRVRLHRHALARLRRR